MTDYNTLLPNKTESHFYSSASIDEHVSADNIARWAEADRLDPFILTSEDLLQYAESGDTGKVIELARIKYRHNQYFQFCGIN